MSEVEIIERIAAKGDGVTASGNHVAGALPGDRVDEGRVVQRGPHHVDPPCRHFRTPPQTGCGGCQLQHADETALAAFIRERVVNAASGQGLTICELLPEHVSPPRARRRATVHGMRTARGAVLGFREARSHRIVDLTECHVVDPALFALIEPLRGLIARHGPARGAIDAHLALTEQGVDVSLSNFPLEGLAATEAVSDFAQQQGLARLSLDQGFGAETVWEPEPVTVALSGFSVRMPPGAFLQATRDAEARMVADTREWLADAGIAADLFSGLGTFAFGLSESVRVLAVEADRVAHLACKEAAGRSGGQVLTMHRDLFRNPLSAEELGRFGAALLDPPRAGAKTQIAEIAASALEKVVYVSCNPSSWARDGAALVEAGFSLTRLRPVGQFRWSNHVELVSLFER